MRSDAGVPHKENPMRTRTGMGAASFVMVLMCASSPDARQNEWGQAIETGFPGAKGAVVATGLDNPRGLDWSHGWLFIAEAGTGGDGSCIPGIFAPRSASAEPER